MTKSDVAFGTFAFDPASGMLRGNGRDARLGQRAAALLQALIAADQQPVTKSALLDAAWPGAVVEEGNLTVQIAALRKALGPRLDGQDWIVTVPRLGYRLLRGDSANASVPGLPTIPVLAVLPFNNLSGDPDQDYFGDGIVEDIITALSRFNSFAVISRNSSFTYKGRAVDVRQVASELGVRYVLEGSVQRTGNRLRITVQMVEGDSGKNIWAEQFDGTLDELFDFQDRITESVVTIVEPRIQLAEIARARRERPGSVATYDIYLQALAKISSETVADNAAAYHLLAKALEQDPNSALLLAYASWVLEHRISNGWPQIGPDDVQQCGELARRGIEQARGDALLMSICGMSLLQGVRDYDIGMAVIQSAYESNPNNLMIVLRSGVANLHCGDLDKALVCGHRANRLSPGDLGSHIALCLIADVCLIRGEFDKAIEWSTKALAINANFGPTLWVLIAANAHLGQPEAARRFLHLHDAMSPGLTISRLRAAQPAKFSERLTNKFEGLHRAGVAE